MRETVEMEGRREGVSSVRSDFHTTDPILPDELYKIKYMQSKQDKDRPTVQLAAEDDTS